MVDKNPWLGAPETLVKLIGIKEEKYSIALSAIGGDKVSRISFIEWNLSQ